MPATHWAGRIAILAVVALMVVSFGVSGAFLGVVRWGAHCGGGTIEYLLSPLLDNHDAVVRPGPAAVCFHSGSGPAAG
jgi:hypothetical protein